MMASANAEAFLTVLALVGVVIIVAALLSGLVERSGLPHVAVFLALGAILGPAGLGLLNVTLESPALRVVATLSLVLVLFTDAVTIDIVELRRHGALALLLVGPGTLLTATLIGLAGWGLLGLAPAAAAILGAALASTDPVLLRSLLRNREIPDAVRQALRLESGLNDAVLLPIVLVAMAFVGPGGASGATDWARLAIDLALLGPGAGVAVGLVAVAALDLIRRRIGIQRDYESLYALGTAFAAYAAAEAVHGSGFLAAFAAGLTISALDVELCDCFLEYGQTTAEMALLFTFVLLGGSLIWSGFSVVGLPTLAFAALALLLRPAVYLGALARASVAPRSRLLIAWFGPRGLSSLLLVLLPVFAGRPGSDQLFAICSLVVLASLVLHGGSPMVMGAGVRRAERRQPGRTADSPAVQMQAVPTPMESPTDGSASNAQATPNESGVATRVPDSDRIAIEDLRQLWASGEPVVVLDARTDRSYNRDELQASGALRLPPDHVAERAAERHLPHDAWLIAYCT